MDDATTPAMIHSADAATPDRIVQFREKNLQQYRTLKDHLPLSTPYALNIDPTNLCNFRCVFCPTGDDTLLKQVGRPKGKMPLELFKKIIDDACEFPEKIKRVFLYKDGEPFLHPDLHHMIAYTKEKAITEDVRVYSNAAAITEKKAIAAIAAGLDSIVISIEHVHAAGYKAITETYSDYEKVVRNVAFLWEEKQRQNSHLYMYIKILDTNLNDDEKRKFYADFTNICDDINIETLSGWANTYDRDFLMGQDPNVGIRSNTPRKKDRVVCPHPFYRLVVNFDGQVSMCCPDWAMKGIVGDVNKEHLVDIWNGQAMKEVRLTHLTGQRNTISICNGCQAIMSCPSQSDLDDAATDLLAKFAG